MKTLLVIWVFYFNYVTSLEKYAVKTYPKKVKPFGAGKILINPAKYMYKPSTPDSSKTTLSDKIFKYTVFQVIGNSKANRGVPDSPYFSLDQVNDSKPRVKKILPDYVWSSLSRVKRSAPEAPASEAPKTESAAPKAENEAPKAESEAPIAASEAPIAASEAPKAVSEASKTESEAPKAESEAPKAESEPPKTKIEVPKAESEAHKTESEAPKAESEAPKAAGIAPKAENIARTAESIAPKVESIAPKVESIAPKVKSTSEPKSRSKKETSTTTKPPAKKKVQTTSQKPKAKNQDIVLRAQDKKSPKDAKKKNITTTKRVEKLRAKLNLSTTKRVAKLRAKLNLTTTKRVEKLRAKLNLTTRKQVGKLRTKLKQLSTAAFKISNKTLTKLNKEDLKRITRAAKKKNAIRKGNNTAVFRSSSSKTNGTRSKKKIKRKSKSKNGQEKKTKSGRRRKSKSKNKKSEKHSSKRSKSKKSARKGKKRTHRDVNSTEIKILKETRRLTGAREALIEEYPYVVSIQKDEEHWCSGALINPRMVITTANCLWKAERISRMEVRCGSSYTDQGGQVAEIAQVIKHPRWGLRNTPDNDVALILLDRNIKFSHSVHAVDLPNRVMYPAFDDAWVTSFGAERRDGIFEAHETNLQVYHTYLMSNETCNNITTRFGVAVTENFICFSQSGKTSPCTRDTGAPAVSDGVLWGLASWSIRKLCGTERFPSMFSYLASHSNMDFITEATRQLMSEKRVYPYLDRSFAPKLKNFPTTQTPFSVIT